MKGLKTKREIKEPIDDNTKFFTQCKDEENEFPVVIYFDYDTDSPYRNHLKWISLKGENYGRMD